MVNVESTLLKVTHCKRDRTKICGFNKKIKKKYCDVCMQALYACTVY